MLGVTRFTVVDNSGCRQINGIKFYKKTPFSKLKIGNLFLGAIHNIRMHKKSRVKKLFEGELKKSFLVRSKNPIYRRDGSFIKFFHNAAILVDNKKKPLASRIVGFLPLDLKRRKRVRFLMCADGILL